MRKWIGVMLAVLAVAAASWWVGQRPYVSPGTHQIFRMDTTLGALLEFLVILALGIMIVARAGRLFAAVAATYIGTVLLVSLLTPKTIVSVGDSYCWDLWCVGIQNVNTTPQGEDVLYTADVAIFVDSTNAQLLRTDGAKQFFYVMDEQGRRFPIVPDAPRVDADLTVKPGEIVRSKLSFLAPANARSLYLTGDIVAPPWVYLYFGSDLNPFHRRTLLRVV